MMLQRRVTSLIRTGASRLERSFLCTQRKLISEVSSTLKVSVMDRSARRREKKKMIHELLANTEFEGDTGDECDQFLVGCDAHTNEPFLMVARRLKSPKSGVKKSISKSSCI